MSVDPALSQLATAIEAGERWPRPSCPKCETGYIRFLSPDESEGMDSASVRDHPAFEPDWVAGTFTVGGECENPACRQVVHGTGNYRTGFAKKREVYDVREHQALRYSSYYTVTHLHPPMLVMSIPQSAPNEVRDGVLRASRVLFADPGLAATALRATVELFLTTSGVPAVRSNGSFCNAHDRIEIWRNGDSSRHLVAEQFWQSSGLGMQGPMRTRT